MMLGTRDTFDYFECAGCSCVQIVDVPANLGAYYPPNYYAFEESRPRGWQPALRRLVGKLARGSGVVTALLDVAVPHPVVRARGWIEITGARRRSSILDVGCGTGLLINDLAEAGFANVLGVDPYIAGDIEYPSGARVVKGSLDDMEGTFDVVMMHHSLEHVPDQLETLQRVARLLARGGWLVVRTPTTSSWAWKH